MAISVREIAKLAGVSSATVSRVLNDSHQVTDETKRRIQRIIDDLSFVPNNRAIHLKSGKSQIYGIIIPDLTNPFFTELVKIFEGMLVESERDLLVANTDFHSTRTQLSLRRMLLRRVDGVALLSSELDFSSLEDLVRNRIPVVTADRYRTDVGISDIVVDFAAGMKELMVHLHELGHRTVGFIGGSPGIVTTRIRREAFFDAMVRQGMSSREEWIVEGNYRIDGGSLAMEKILACGEYPTAVVTANDLTAIGAMRMAHAKGLEIPRDLSIAGCDDIEISDIVNPPLTTMCISRREYARMLMEALDTTSQNLGAQGRQYALPAKLVIRASTGPAPAR